MRASAWRLLALLFPVITASRTVREPDVYYASGRTGTPMPTTVPGDINVNTADLETLMTLPGVGEVIGQRIIETREAVGLLFLSRRFAAGAGDR